MLNLSHKLNFATEKWLFKYKEWLKQWLIIISNILYQIIWFNDKNLLSNVYLYNSWRTRIGNVVNDYFVFNLEFWIVINLSSIKDNSGGKIIKTKGEI